MRPPNHKGIPALGVTDVGRDIRVLPDVFPVVVEETAVMPISLPVVVETGPRLGVNRTCYCPNKMWRWILRISDALSEICRK